MTPVDTVRVAARPARAALGRFRRPAGLDTPARVRVLAVAALVVTVALFAVLTTGVAQVRGGVKVIAGTAAPQVVVTTDLYFEINAMDADVANTLLIGDGAGLTGAPGHPAATAALGGAADADYQRQRTRADRDLQLTVGLADGTPAGRQAVRTLLDGLGRYEALVADALLLDHPRNGRPASPGRPPAASVRLYEQATDVMHRQVLPAARSLTTAGAESLDTAYARTRSAIGATRSWLIALGVLLLAVLPAFQVLLARRFHRRLSPPLPAAALLVAVLTALGAGLLTSEAGHLRVAKADAFDSVLALSRARAVGYDANAYESRWLVDPGRADAYQDAFLAESQQLADLPGATIGTYDARLARALTAYRAGNADHTDNTDNTDNGFGGFFGTELRNITFPGERAAAERTLAAYQAYERDDRRLRALAGSGHLTAAIGFDTGTAADQSDGAFARYDRALTSLIAVNQHGFDAAASAAGGELAGWDAIPAAAALAVLALVLLAARPRLAEYR